MPHALGEAPRYEEFAEPTPNEDEALVRVRAASLKSSDKMMADGSHYDNLRQLPAVVGLDGVGVLEDGARVYCGAPRPPYGTMAEQTVVPRAFCIPVPDAVDDLTAAALPNPAMSSWLALGWRARLEPGETVLVLGATGVASLTGHDLMAEPKRTRLVQIGEMAGPILRLPAAAVRSSGLEVLGSGGGSIPPAAIFEMFPRLWELAARGELRVDAEPVALSDVEEAWQRSNPSGRRLVLVP